jgi:hypothetical protein
VDVDPVDGDVLADRSRLDPDGVEMFLGHEQDLAPGRVPMRATLEPLPLEGANPLARLGAPAAATRGDEQTDHGCHVGRVSVESELP